MGVQEGVVFSKRTLARPCGVAFGGGTQGGGSGCATRTQDEQQWADLVPALEAEIDRGRHIAVLVQTRNTRPWDNSKHNFDFRYDEDYLIAAYSVDETFGEPWVPGSLSRIWLTRTTEMLVDKRSARHAGDWSEVAQVFECSPKGCNLSTVGSIKLINFHVKQGKTLTEATALGLNAMADGEKFGWKGRWLGVY